MLDNKTRLAAMRQLDVALNAVAPIEALSIGRWHNKRSWRIDFLPAATDAQKEAAQAVLDAFDLRSVVVREASPAEKLAAFLKSNPDVAKMIEGQGN